VCLPLLIFPCAIKSRSSLLAPAHPGGPRKRAVKWLWWWCDTRATVCLEGLVFKVCRERCHIPLTFSFCSVNLLVGSFSTLSWVLKRKPLELRGQDFLKARCPSSHPTTVPKHLILTWHEFTIPHGSRFYDVSTYSPWLTVKPSPSPHLQSFGKRE